MLSQSRHTTALQMADDAWNQMLAYAIRGIPGIYHMSPVPPAPSQLSRAVYAYLADWWQELPWDVDSRIAAVEHLLQKPAVDFQVIAEGLDFDMRRELRECLAEMQALH